MNWTRVERRGKNPIEKLNDKKSQINEWNRRVLQKHFHCLWQWSLTFVVSSMVKYRVDAHTKQTVWTFIHSANILTKVHTCVEKTVFFFFINDYWSNRRYWSTWYTIFNEHRDTKNAEKKVKNNNNTVLKHPMKASKSCHLFLE